MLKKNREYLILVPLIRKITQIESALNTLEAKGESIQAKVQSIEELNSTDFILRINKIIGLRNCALHGELEETKITQALDECEIVLQVIEKHRQIHLIKEKIKKKLKFFETLYKENNIVLIEPIELKKDNSIAYLNSIIKNDENRLLELETYIKEYWKTKIFIPLAKYIAIAGVVYYLWSKLYQ